MHLPRTIHSLNDNTWHTTPDDVLRHIIKVADNPCGWNAVAGKFENSVRDALVKRGIEEGDHRTFCVFYTRLRKLYNTKSDADLLRALQQEWYGPDDLKARREWEGIEPNPLGAAARLVGMFKLHKKVKAAALVAQEANVFAGYADYEAQELYYLGVLNTFVAQIVWVALPSRPKPRVPTEFIEYAFCVLRMCSDAQRNSSLAFDTWCRYDETEEEEEESFPARLLDISKRFLVRFVEVVPLADVNAYLLSSREQHRPHRVVDDVAVWKALFARKGAAQMLFRENAPACTFELCSTEQVRSNIEVLKEALAACKDASDNISVLMQCINTELRSDVESMKQLVDVHAYAYAFAMGKATNNKELLQRAFDNLLKVTDKHMQSLWMYDMYQRASDEGGLRSDANLAERVLATAPDAYELMEINLKKSKKLYMIAIEGGNTDARLTVSTDLRGDTKLMLATLRMMAKTRDGPVEKMLWCLRKPAIVNDTIIEQILSASDPVTEHSVLTARSSRRHEWNMRYHPLVEAFVTCGREPRNHLWDELDDEYAKTMLTDPKFMAAWTTQCPWLLAGLEGLTIEDTPEWFTIIQDAMEKTSGAVMVFAPLWYRYRATKHLSALSTK